MENEHTSAKLGTQASAMIRKANKLRKDIATCNEFLPMLSAPNRRALASVLEGCGLGISLAGNALNLCKDKD